MFGNFIYFIVVLLIYLTHPASEDTDFTGPETFLLFFCLTAGFAALTRLQFRRFEKRIFRENPAHLDHRFHQLLTRQSVIAIFLFAADIYWLNLPAFFTGIRLFDLIPTCQALVFLGIFLGYLSIVWACAHEAYQKLYTSGLSARSYVISNISFAIPVLLPWLLLSGVADLIHALPFDLPGQLLSTTVGEVIYFIFFLFAVAIFGPVMIQKFWQCTPLGPGYARQQIEALCRKAGLEYADILRWPIFEGRMLTAGVMGLIRHFRYILVTDALLRMLRPEEIDAVIAHEIGHIKRNHLLFYLFFFGGYLLFSYATFDLITYLIIYTEPVYRFLSADMLSSADITSFMYSAVTILSFLIYFRYIFGYFMRNFERQADIYVYTLFDSAQPLIATFEKIAITSGQSPDKPNWHHFSITERISYLKKCEADKGWIARHDRKVRKSIAVYLIGTLLLGGIGYYLNFGETGKKLNRIFSEKVIQRELEKNPDNPELHSILGDIFHHDKEYGKAIDAYQKSLQLRPDNPHILNNLAWLYATCDDKSLHDPEKAVALSQKAADLLEAPHILDTLAESYYVNGQFAEAVSAGKHAMKLADKDHSYYEKQLRKFRRALETGNAE